MWGTPAERETWRRTRAAVAAYAYELAGESILDDFAYDALCSAIDPTIATGRPELDAFFLLEFEADTGLWIHKHPDLAGVKKLYEKQFKGRSVRPLPDWAMFG